MTRQHAIYFAPVYALDTRIMCLRRSLTLRSWLCTGAVGFTLCIGGCCSDSNRDWTIVGTVVNSENEPIEGAFVDVTLFFTIDGPGNQRAESVQTDSDGAFTVPIIFTASCSPVAFGFFGSEASNTSGTPRSVVVSVTHEGNQSEVRFDIRNNPELVTEFETIDGFGTRGTVSLPPIVLDTP
jgi:hypothetical protein